MRVLRSIHVALIDTDRLPIGPRTLALAKHLEQGGGVPPIHVLEAGNGRFRVLDGRHRLLAHRLTGRTTIAAKYGVRKADGK